ncbi:protein of unknown function [Petrocella atlantisensis]|uniref:Restriction endonuclease type IV Mrr domain-containing protein n=1 Tax=Petrocella atlantisensis TaxID=2173034 RepID=A0A3P7Q1M8_9FIRM|nr:restriction endonuclease [Petrocella atlantisensis]VDN49241.1 protein of unknown function [Petrocella atlantisensis]
MNRNAKSPWNPKKPLSLSAKDFELKVVEWLRKSSIGLNNFEVKHLEKVEGNSGEYEFDAIASLTILGGAEIVVAIECKRYGRPVEREKLLALHSKAYDIRANKSMIFSTSGYQSGALQYAVANKIATLVLVDDSFHYETRSKEKNDIPMCNKISGIFMTATEEGSIRCQATNSIVVNCLKEWLNN